jgi:hypothetical protein
MKFFGKGGGFHAVDICRVDDVLASPTYDQLKAEQPYVWCELEVEMRDSPSDARRRRSHV